MEHEVDNRFESPIPYWFNRQIENDTIHEWYDFKVAGILIIILGFQEEPESSREKECHNTRQDEFGDYGWLGFCIHPVEEHSSEE